MEMGTKGAHCHEIAWSGKISGLLEVHVFHACDNPESATR